MRYGGAHRRRRVRGSRRGTAQARKCQQARLADRRDAASAVHVSEAHSRQQGKHRHRRLSRSRRDADRTGQGCGYRDVSGQVAGPQPGRHLLIRDAKGNRAARVPRQGNARGDRQRRDRSVLSAEGEPRDGRDRRSRGARALAASQRGHPDARLLRCRLRGSRDCSVHGQAADLEDRRRCARNGSIRIYPSAGSR